jgi:hypothetical protein
MVDGRYCDSLVTASSAGRLGAAAAAELGSIERIVAAH